MRELLNKAFLIVYNAWAFFWFAALFILFLPFLLLGTTHEKLKFIGHFFLYSWANLFLFLTFKWPIKEYNYRPDPSKVYIYTANHFAYLDVALGMSLFKKRFKFMGKSSVTKVPVFGHIFNSLHIAVDRSAKNSRANALLKSSETLRDNMGIFIMPEGGILSKNIPEMHTELKDGAFKLAKDLGVPILPITFVNNYKLMPNTFLTWGRVKLVFHKPIDMKNHSIAEAKDIWRKTVQGQIEEA